MICIIYVNIYICTYYLKNYYLLLSSQKILQFITLIQLNKIAFDKLF